MLLGCPISIPSSYICYTFLLFLYYLVKFWVLFITSIAVLQKLGLRLILIYYHWILLKIVYSILVHKFILLINVVKLVIISNVEVILLLYEVISETWIRFLFYRLLLIVNTLTAQLNSGTSFIAKSIWCRCLCCIHFILVCLYFCLIYLRNYLIHSFFLVYICWWLIYTIPRDRLNGRIS